MLSAMTNFKTLYFIKIKASSLLVAFFFSFFLIGCESKVDTAAAVITVQPVSKLYIKDDTAAPLNVTVKVKDKGIISYQWYSNTVNSNENGNAIQDAVQQTYTPSTLNTGKIYYYAVVTNTNSNASGKKETSVNSDTAEIIIIAPGTTVDAATPVITKHPKNDFYVKGDIAAPLSVNATVDDKGTLSYQWYSNTVNSNENGTLIPNGTKQTYKPLTSKTGTFYYYTVVTSTNSNVNGKKEISVKSDTVKIEVSNTAVTTYSINFYDKDLNLAKTITEKEGTVNISGSWYKAGENSPSSIHNLTKNINFYAVANVKEITDQTELYSIRNNLSGTYILLKDIVLDDKKAGFDGSGWIPIITFQGIFNGNNHKITDIWIDRPDSVDIGFFGRVDGAVIKNLGIETASGKKITGSRNTGGIAGSVVDNSKITNSYSTGNISGEEDVGGIVGIVTYNSKITNSYSTGNVSGEKRVGGIAGYAADSKITNSYSTGDISGEKRVGGIAGIVIKDSKITNSYSTGNISGKEDVGGIAGHVIYNSKITNSYSAGDISGERQVGGIAGYVEMDSKITNSYSAGDISGENRVGGIAGYVEMDSDIQNSAAINPSVTGSTNVNHIVGFGGYKVLNSFALNTMKITGSLSGNAEISKSLTELKTKSTYSNGLGWSFGDNDDNPWKIDSAKNNGLPYLYWQEL